MGATQSTQEHDEEDEDEDDEETVERETESHKLEQNGKKVLEQEPEVLPCHPSASPLSPQLSSLGSPYLGPSIRVYDPYNVLSQTHLPVNQSFAGGSLSLCNSDEVLEEDTRTEVFFINHGECSMNMRPDLVGGRWPNASLTANGMRQARALAVFLKSQGVVFNAVFSSPLDRAKRTALSVCQEQNIPPEKIQSSDSLIEMSQGQWEGCVRSEIYTPEIISFIEISQPDFSPPAGESLRQVEFRMIEFLNSTILRRSEKLKTRDSSFQSEIKEYSSQNTLIQGNPSLERESLAAPQWDSHHKGYPIQNSLIQANPVQERESPSIPQWDLLHRHKQGMRKKSGKSRLQFVTMGDNETDDDFCPRDSKYRQLREVESKSSYCIGVFSHGVAIKCLLTGLLGCSPVMAQRICIDDSSTTVIQHSLKTGWQIKRVNDTAHLRLL
ncbi:uncharacterized protein LOC18434394 [Amborella trichopoda]|uniref:Uncharacterized protein n=1 Tax=Amborella trichopoda TaxID=13333 RepID=W1PE30_AMBTC|nr:uncharacterized protein LOC18434394 [Amborella trichopoda]ERN06203.1 hypothetical protein AMTR_s00016p00159040 [Amborella trichopoda]|eukprot:XP_006844528.1 uncharacterized protein LOC18434394 [Amborella trichopoda]